MLRSHTELTMKARKQNQRPAIKRENSDSSGWVKWVKSVPPVRSNQVKGNVALEMSIVEWSMLSAIAARRGTTVDTAARDLLLRHNNLGVEFERLQ